MKKIMTAVLFLLVTFLASSVVFADTVVTIYKDGYKQETTAYMVDGEPWLTNTMNEVPDIFKEETEGTLWATVIGVKSPLKKWADEYGYVCILDKNANAVYLYKKPQSQPQPQLAPIEVWYNFEKVNFPDQSPVIQNDRTLVPIRAISEALGYEVKWNPEAQNVVISNGYYEMGLFIGASYYYLNGKRHSMDVSPQIIGDRTMVPVRFVSEAFGKEVLWDTSDPTARRVWIFNPTGPIK